MDRQKIEPDYFPETTIRFDMPRNTKIYDYKRHDDETVPDTLDKLLYEGLRIKKDLVDGSKVKPRFISKPGESCVDKVDYYQVFNGALMDSMRNVKVTLTQDLVDSGKRKIVEEI